MVRYSFLDGVRMSWFEGKKVLIVGIGKTGFNLINFFNTQNCEITVTDIKPIFDLNKAVKKLKKVNPVPKDDIWRTQRE